MDENFMEYAPHELSKSSCRVCLQNGEICNSFFDVVNCNGVDKELRELYSSVTKIEVPDDEIKPTQICETCTSKLLTAVEFILNAEKSEEILAQYVTQIDEPLADKSPLTSTDFDFNLEIGEDDEIDTQTISNAIPFKEEMLEDIKREESDEPCSQKQSEHFEILDEFEFIVQNEADNTVEIITESQTEQNNEGKNLLKAKDPTARNTVGSRLSLNNNARTHRYNCTDCQRTFAKLQTFQRHIENAHTYAPREEIAAKQLNEPTIQCPQCPRNFMHKNDLQRHMLAIHPPGKDELTTDQNDCGDPLKIKRKYSRGLCPHCGRDFPVASLNIHIRRHLGVNPYKCKECGKGFPRKQDLTVHERHHSGERPHVCTVCGKSFIRPNKLSRHMRIHLGIRPYKCDECGKCFSQSNDLKLHMRRHSGEKPYACGICSESFISGTLLRIHRRTKSHHEPDSNDPDPFINCRVNTRTLLNNT